MVILFIIIGLCIIGFALWGWFSDKCIFSIVVGSLLGAIIGIVAGMLICLPISGVYYIMSENYAPETQTYDLAKYNIEGEKSDYYVYMINRDGQLTSSVEYFDEDDCPQIVNVENRTNYIYDKDAKPSIEITKYNSIDSIWVVDFFKDSNNPLDEYVVTLPDSSVIYYSQK